MKLKFWTPEHWYEGKEYDSECAFCQQRHNGTIFRNRFYWCVRFDNDCGREKILGYTMPKDALVEKGLTTGSIETSDPNQQSLLDALSEEMVLKEKWAIDKEESGLPRKRYI